MDPKNFMAMFGSYEDDFEQEEQNRKNIREYKYVIAQNAKLKKQCEVMIRQIQQNNEKKKVQIQQRIAKMEKVVRLKENSRIAQKVYQDLVAETLRRASIVQANAEKKGEQLSEEELYLISKLNEIRLQQDKNFMRHNKLQENFSADSKEHKQWKEIAEKEKKVLEAENLLKAKRIEMEILKKERDYVKKQTEERHTYLRKEIAYYDNLIKDKKDKQELKAKLLADIDAVNAEIEAEKEKIGHKNGSGTIGTIDSQESEVEFSPIVFKDPNDFPLLSEFLRSPSVKRVSSKSQKAKQKAKEKIAKKMTKGSNLSRKKSKFNIHSQPGPLTSNSGNSSLLQRSNSNIKQFSPSTSHDLIDDKHISPLPSQQSFVVASPQKKPTEKSMENSKKNKKAQKSNDTPKKKVSFADNFEKPEEIISTPPPKKINEMPTTPKPKDFTLKIQADEFLLKEKIADGTPKGPQKKIKPKTLAQKPQEQMQKTPEIITPMEVDQPFEQHSSNDEKKRLEPKKASSNEIIEFDIIPDDCSVDLDSLFNNSGSVTGSKSNANCDDDFDFSFLDNANVDENDFNVGFDNPFENAGKGTTEEFFN